MCLIDKKQLVSVSDDDIYDTLDENMWASRKIHSVYT